MPTITSSARGIQDGMCSPLRLTTVRRVARLRAARPRPPAPPAVPVGRTTEATVLGIRNERFSHSRGGATRGGIHAGRPKPDAGARRQHSGQSAGVATAGHFGGGENGAFGAGLLNSWTEHGSRL